MTTPNEREAREPMFGAMLEADFEKNTVTFEMCGEYYAAAGLYEIRPHVAAITREQREVPPGLYDLDPYRLPQQEAPGAVAFQHKWSDDGETCVHCGDKDWMGDKCSGPRTATPPAPVDVRAFERVLCECVVKHQFSDEHRRGRLTLDVETFLHEWNERKADLDGQQAGVGR